jgi:hypothetical protein
MSNALFTPELSRLRRLAKPAVSRSAAVKGYVSDYTEHGVRAAMVAAASSVAHESLTSLVAASSSFIASASPLLWIAYYVHAAAYRPSQKIE